jgi:CRISPR-associated protein Csb2
VARALAWLESQAPPVVAAPRATRGQDVVLFVPNNDLDAKGADPRAVAGIRVAKHSHPHLFDPAVPFAYAWRSEGIEEFATERDAILELAQRLYQFGRGVDAAWAVAESMEDDAFDAWTAAYPGKVYQPAFGPATSRSAGPTLACPTNGSLASLRTRHLASLDRLRAVTDGAKGAYVFAQPPKLYAAQVAYDSPPARAVFDVRDSCATETFAGWPQAESAHAATALRDAAAARLAAALPGRESEVERALVGRAVGSAPPEPAERRIRLVPLPSIGHAKVDRDVRRLLVEVPAGCLLAPADVFWAFSGLTVGRDGDAITRTLTRADDTSMLGHYGIGDARAHRVWRTITPAALPERAGRRRISPDRVAAEAKGAPERAAEESRARAATVQALRHAGVTAQPLAVHVQREPFGARGDRAEAFASGPRFVKERLWHVELTFGAPVSGPLVIGDGRFLGLGLMAPEKAHGGVWVFHITGGLTPVATPSEMTRALRRAVMARVQATLGPRALLPEYFSGHTVDGSPSQAGGHLAFVADTSSSRLLLVAPHMLLREAATRHERRQMEVLELAIADLAELRAGASGLLQLARGHAEESVDLLLAPARGWVSITPYAVNRHVKGLGARDALASDLRRACEAAHLPTPEIEVGEIRGVAGSGLEGFARLRFEVAVPGPILLGRTRFEGGGAFRGEH